MAASSPLWVKICGLMTPEQTVAVARHGASAIGFICVPASPRYVPLEQLGTLATALITQGYGAVERVGVVADADWEGLQGIAASGHVTALQLHGQESPALCQRLRATYPELTLIKAFRIRRQEDLGAIAPYYPVVDRILLDAYHPHLLGGTGHTLPWEQLQAFRPPLPWILAGGLTPDNVQTALGQLQPNGIDLSSGVETCPGHKDLSQVAHLFQTLATLAPALGSKD